MAENTSSDASEDTTSRMERALRRIRREGLKAAFVHAVVEAVALFLAANLVLSVFDPGWFPTRVPIPGTLAGALGWSEPVTLPGAALVAAGLSALALVVGTWLRVRRPLVERFEAVNPPVAEALRTARDAVADGSDSRMARRLYGDVLDRLQRTSSRRLLDVWRLGATLLVVVALSLATVQVAVYDVTLAAGSETDESGSTDLESGNFTGLRDADEVLGEREEVSAGDENLSARVESTGGDSQVDDAEQFPTAGGPGGGGGSGGTESQQAGFASPEEVEDADLIREYNIRIREDSQED